MLAQLYEESTLVRHTFAQASDVLGYDIAKICLESGHEDQLQDITFSAPIIVATGVAAFRHLRKNIQVDPALMAGHSLGEYTALTCAGVFSFDEALEIVRIRAQLAQRVMATQDGVMSVILKLDVAEVEELCRQEVRMRGGQVWPSCLNAARQVCVAGTEADVAALEGRVTRLGGSFRRLTGNAPYHTPLMESVIREFHDVLRGAHIGLPQFPVIANVSARPYTERTTINNLLEQLQRPVKWMQTMDYIGRQNIHSYVELGSGQILTRLLRAQGPDVTVYNYETVTDRLSLEEALLGSTEVARPKQTGGVYA
jgi:[acyl-carrier-protein] S-malonyltransferase